MSFSVWLDTFIKEKEVELEVLRVKYEDTVHFVDLDVLIEFINQLDDESQGKIKDTLVRIDFLNGDVLHFLNHLAEGMVNHYQQQV